MATAETQHSNCAHHQRGVTRPHVGDGAYGLEYVE